MKNFLLDKIKSREAVIGIIGLGYVGLPLILRFCETGYRVSNIILVTAQWFCLLVDLGREAFCGYFLGLNNV